MEAGRQFQLRPLFPRYPSLILEEEDENRGERSFVSGVKPNSQSF